MMPIFRAELVNKFSKYIKTIGNRVVEVEFYWFQANPCQNYRLRINEKQFYESQKYICSKKLLNIKFAEFIDLIAPVFANDAAEISSVVLRSTFDHLFDQSSNGKIEQEDFDSLFILLQGLNTYKQNLLHENLRQIRTNHISFTEFYDLVKSGYLRELLMRVTALIVSSLNGFGLNLVHKFAKQGYNIVLNGHENDEKLIRTIQNEYRQSQIISLSTNIQNEINIQKLIEQISNYFQHIEILIINNECQRHYRASIEEFPIEKWREIIDYNLISTFTLIKTLWPHMKRQHFGRIINIANEHSLIASEYQSACIAAHYAMLGLNKVLSIEGASFGITSNVICPGHSETNTFEQFSHIKTLADLILFLCTDQGHSITGQSISWNIK